MGQNLAKHSKSLNKQTMRYKEFFKKLDKFYNGTSYKYSGMYKVKFYLQANTFSFDIYKKDHAFWGDPDYRSEIYYMWDNHMLDIIKDIKKQLKQLNKEIKIKDLNK